MLFWHLMDITNDSLICIAQQQLKPIVPSFAKHAWRTKILSFDASVQHIRNVSLVVQCEEYRMWCLLYAPRKLSSIAIQELVNILDDMWCNFH